METKLNQAQETISTLNEKINNVLENNQSLLRTVQVFQRQFIRREGGALGKLPIDNNTAGPFHLEVVRNMKSKLNNIVV